MINRHTTIQTASAACKSGALLMVAFALTIALAPVALAQSTGSADTVGGYYYIDPSTGGTYYYNQASGTGNWTDVTGMTSQPITVDVTGLNTNQNVYDGMLNPYDPGNANSAFNQGANSTGGVNGQGTNGTSDYQQLTQAANQDDSQTGPAANVGDGSNLENGGTSQGQGGPGNGQGGPSGSPYTPEQYNISAPPTRPSGTVTIGGSVTTNDSAAGQDPVMEYGQSKNGTVPLQTVCPH